MAKKEEYKNVYQSFKELCARGQQPCSFRSYCSRHGVDRSRMRDYLKDEYRPVKTLPGYRVMKDPMSHVSQYLRVYEEFKRLCSRGEQACSFAQYCDEHSLEKTRVYMYLHRQGLSIAKLAGYRSPSMLRKCQEAEVPFEDVIFEEAGFLPAGGSNAITVKVDGHVSVSFPADTDVAVIVKFVRKIGKEVGHVGA